MGIFAFAGFCKINAVNNVFKLQIQLGQNSTINVCCVDGQFELDEYTQPKY